MKDFVTILFIIIRDYFMTDMFIKTYAVARQMYPNLIEEIDLEKEPVDKVKEFENHKYQYFGKVLEEPQKSDCWKITKIFQMICTSFLVPLTLGLVLLSAKYRKFLSEKVKEIKNRTEPTYIYVKEHFQHKNEPNVQNQPPVQPENKPHIPNLLEKKPIDIQQEVPVNNFEDLQNFDSIDLRSHWREFWISSFSPGDGEKDVTEFYSSLSDEHFLKLLPQFLKNRSEQIENEPAKLSNGCKEILSKVMPVIIEKAEKNLKRLDVAQICQLIFLSEYFKTEVSFLEKIPKEMIKDIVEKFTQSIPS